MVSHSLLSQFVETGRRHVLTNCVGKSLCPRKPCLQLREVFYTSIELARNSSTHAANYYFKVSNPENFSILPRSLMLLLLLSILLILCVEGFTKQAPFELIQVTLVVADCTVVALTSC